MRTLMIAADVAMGLILGLFLYVTVSRSWPSLQNPIVAVLVFAASVLVVLFRRPNGSLAPRNGRSRS